ncbi:hypothetical protein BX600DRAFT_24353 [Xylariales sp. PMI_506]|nr:hypothetical protein BX600DRAFT_24353 [Xylariales sp. PMI_506]
MSSLEETTRLLPSQPGDQNPKDGFDNSTDDPEGANKLDQPVTGPESESTTSGLPDDSAARRDQVFAANMQKFTLWTVRLLLGKRILIVLYGSWAGSVLRDVYYSRYLDLELSELDINPYAYVCASAVIILICLRAVLVATAVTQLQPGWLQQRGWLGRRSSERANGMAESFIRIFARGLRALLRILIVSALWLATLYCFQLPKYYFQATRTDWNRLHDSGAPWWLVTASAPLLMVDIFGMFFGAVTTVIVGVLTYVMTFHTGEILCDDVTAVDRERKMEEGLVAPQNNSPLQTKPGSSTMQRMDMMIPRREDSTARDTD